MEYGQNGHPRRDQAFGQVQMGDRLVEKNEVITFNILEQYISFLFSIIMIP
jgi:hypothetical protein